MDQFRRSSGEGKDSPTTDSFQQQPPHVITIRESAFSRPILPTSSSLLLSPTKPKPTTGPPNGVIGSGSTPEAPPPPPPPQPETSSSSSSSAGRYKECLRNHAASLGGHVVDGCGEFMPAGPAEPMKCAACGCHRSFHRREPEPDGSPSYRVQLLLPQPPAPKTLGFGGSGNTTESSSEERANNYHGELGKKKRFRTKFSGEQKEKMMAFAERVEWRVQKKDETEMERFCRDIGVTRQVLKVWMHNNKHLVRKQQQQLEIGKEEVEQQPQPQPEPEPERQLGDKDVMS